MLILLCREYHTSSKHPYRVCRLVGGTHRWHCKQWCHVSYTIASQAMQCFRASDSTLRNTARKKNISVTVSSTRRTNEPTSRNMYA